MIPLRIVCPLMLFSVISSGCARPEQDPQPLPLGPAPAPQVAAAADNSTDVLVYVGESVWQAEVDALTYLLYNHHVSYRTVVAAELNSMSQEEFGKTRLLIIPGGDGATITNSLTLNTRFRLRAAVKEQGLAYLGFCAGAWIAYAPAALPGRDVDYGLGVIEGPFLKENFLSKQGVKYIADHATLASGVQHDLLWYGGPITPDVPGGVIARYSDGTPAITQASSGKGFVIVSGLHPSVTHFTLNLLGVQTEASAPEFAWQLIEAAMDHAPLPAF